jgi:hypothetical protein
MSDSAINGGFKVPCPYCGVPISLDPAAHGGHADGSCVKRKPAASSGTATPEPVAPYPQDIDGVREGVEDPKTDAVRLRVIARFLLNRLATADEFAAALREREEDSRRQFTAEDVAMLHRIGPILQAFARGDKPTEQQYDDAHAAYYHASALADRIRVAMRSRAAVSHEEPTNG